MSTTETAYEWHVVGTASNNEQAMHLCRLVDEALQEHPKVKGLHVYDRNFGSYENAMAYLRAKAEEFAFDEENRRDLLDEVNRLETLTWAGVMLHLKRVNV